MVLKIVSVVALIAVVRPGLLMADDHQAVVQAMAEKRNEHVLEVLTTQLTLDPDQQTTVKAALASQTQRLMDLQKEMIDRQTSILKETESQITSSLTENQKEKYPDVKAQLQKEEAQLKNQHLNLGGGTGAGGESESGGMGRHGGRHGGMGGGF